MSDEREFFSSITHHSSRSPIFQIPNAVSQSMPALLESLERALFIARHEARITCNVFKIARRVEHFAHLLCVVFPIRCESQRSAGRDDSREQRNEWRLNQATLVMA